MMIIVKRKNIKMKFHRLYLKININKKKLQFKQRIIEIKILIKLVNKYKVIQKLFTNLKILKKKEQKY
jgi:hypothetical protein